MSFMKNTATTHDVIIVGAGLVGASLACAIARTKSNRRLRIAVIEAGQEPPAYKGAHVDPRVVALTPASRKWLEQVGAWDSIERERVCAYRDMHVWDGEGTAEIHFSSADVRQHCLGYIIENSVAVRAVREQLTQLASVNGKVEINTDANIEIIQPASVIALTLPDASGGIVEVGLNTGARLSASLVIAADGAQSQVRYLADLPTREWDYNQRAIVTTVRTELSNQFTAWQRFMHTGPLALLPLEDVDGAHYCSIVWSADDALAEELMDMDDKEFCVRLGRAFEYKLGQIESCAERFSIPLRQRHARRYIKPGIALVGDAAHNIHPLAGQGVNLGLLDAAALAGEIERAQLRQIPLNDPSVLRRYQRQRISDNLAMMGAMEGFKRLFGANSLSTLWLRNQGLRWTNSLPLIKNQIIKRAMGL